MPFHIQPIKEFVVRPALPDSLSRLPQLASNLMWCWDHNIRSLFRRLDPALWRACQHNPVLMLGRLPQPTLEKVGADPRYLAAYRRACERFDSYVPRPDQPPGSLLVAYFSMEYGLVESLPIYSGGLGVLSGDHLKASSDADVPLVGVGLLYQKGYLQQHLNPDGWQHERYPMNDFFTWPVKPVMDASGNEMKIAVPVPGGPAWIKVWRMDVGRIPLYLLDSNIPENAATENREITDQLYGGDLHKRIRQEIVLGIGGLRALKAVGLEPTVYHLNEGHSAFLAFERIRVLIQERGLSFDEALEVTRSDSVFTTHTSVPAGIDLFDPGLVFEYLGDYCHEAGIPFERLLGLGRRYPNDPHERFSMAISAINTSCYRNAVSKLHRHVSQEMWQELWPNLPLWEVPITSITNGVHLQSWLNGDLAMLYDQYLQPDWRERHNDPSTWDLVADIPDSELWEARRRRKRRLIAFVRERVTSRALDRKASAAELRRLSDVLDPDTFTIGFARRFATYKRATLLFRDGARLRKLLTNPERRVQIVIAGKAHPKDHPGKALIREIVQLSRDPELFRHLVFLEDYDIEVARELVHGVDLWLNTPRRGEEACGTSGMKAGINGVLNMSILDGWFDEAYERSGGWAIGDREDYAEDQDDIHATAIYSLLENEIVPMFYVGREEGVPEDWMARVKQSLTHISPMFNSQRMVTEYLSELYQPAHEKYARLSANNFASARNLLRWKNGVDQVWDRVHFIDSSAGHAGSVVAGVPIPLSGTLFLAGLQPSDVRVEAVVGKVGSSGQLEETEVITLPYKADVDGGVVFTREFIPRQTGRLGYSLRVTPDHLDDPLTRPCNAPVKWSTI